jgi:putative transcription antitermination factor YqgF
MLGCDAIVIGIPVTTEGSIRRRQTDSQQGRRCRNFADAVAALTVNKDLYVYLVDERGTTLEAEALIGYLGGGKNDQKKKKDSVAAALILSAFFNEPRQAIRVRPPRVIKRAQPKKHTSSSIDYLQKGSCNNKNAAAAVKKKEEGTSAAPTAAIDGV